MTIVLLWAILQARDGTREEPEPRPIRAEAQTGAAARPAATSTATPGSTASRLPARLAPPSRSTVVAADAGPPSQAWQEAISKDIDDRLMGLIEECFELAEIDRRDGEIALELELVGEPSKGVMVVGVEERTSYASEQLLECVRASTLDVQVPTATPGWYEGHWQVAVTTRDGRRFYTWTAIHID